MTAPSLSPAPGRRRPAPLRAVVVSTERLTPRLVRISVTGPGFDSYRWPGPAAHLKLLLPEPGAADVELPEPDADDTVDFAASRVPTMRTYTARRFDPETRVLDIDVVLHGDGPAATWAQQATPGDRLAVTRPRNAGFVEDPDADWVLLAGDASALPAIATIAPGLSAPATILMDVPDPADQIDLGRPARWLSTTQEPPATQGLTAAHATEAGGRLEAAVASFAPPPGRGQVWVAAEAGVIRRIRAELLTRFDASQITTRVYWRHLSAPRSAGAQIRFA